MMQWESPSLRKTAMKRLIALPLLALCCLAPAAWSQTAIQPGTITGTFDALGYLHGYTPIYTVPEGKIARVTDLHFINYSDANCMAYMNFGPTQRWFYVPARASLVVPLNTGFGMLSGQAVSGASCGSGTVALQLRGFYFTIP